MADFGTCLDRACGTRVARGAERCTACGGPVRRDGASKWRGGLLAGLGLFLLCFVGWIGAEILPAMLAPGLDPGGSRFTGTQEQGRTVLSLFAALMAFAATTMVYGVYMLATGRQNRLFMLASLLLFAALAYYGWTITGWEQA